MTDDIRLELIDEPLSLDRSFDLPGLRGEGGGPLLAGAARLRAELRPGPRGVELEGRIEAVARFECSRCLEPFERALSGEFRLLLVPDAVEFGSGETELAASDAALWYAEGGRVDLRALGREQILLLVPLKPLCSPSCRGLCPTCGADRNRIECACPRGAVDPRLAPLEELKRKLRGDTGSR